MPRTNKSITVTEQEISNAAIERACAWVNEPGKRITRKERIATALMQVTGEPFTRQMVSRWLTPDVAKRRQPLFGRGLLLLAVVDWLIHLPTDKPLPKQLPQSITVHLR